MSLPETFTSSVMLLQAGLLHFLKNSLEFFCMKYSFSCVAYFATLAKLFMLSSDVLLYLIFTNFDTLRFYSIFGFQGTNYYFEDFTIFNGDGGIRTLDPLLARQVLSQLSYTPI